MKAKILGSGDEVGKSAIVVNDGRTSIMLDCGVRLNPEPPSYPDIKNVDGAINAAILSHAHLDHCGALPMLFERWKPPVFMNSVTLELSLMLIRDSMKVGKKNGYNVPFTEKSVKKMAKMTRLVNYNEKFSVNDFSCRLYQSGHIPGSAGTLLNNKKKVFYTSDIQTARSHLLYPCVLPDSIDTLIIESTYGLRDHPDRLKEERRLVQSIEEVMANEETALIPVFAVGRAQEILLILHEYADKIALDGMAKQSSEIIASYSNYVKDIKMLKNVLRKIFWVSDRKKRKVAAEKYPIILSSAGMLGGGPAVSYLRNISKKSGSRVLFTGFLVEDSPGRNLIQTKIFQNTEEKFHVHCELEQFNLSAHAGRSGLFDIIKRTKPSQVICVHGDNCEQFAKDISETFKIDAYAPKNGETIRI
ncbi:MAG: MBL fold metallo-hydrolase [Candidatus Aenigmatarchaeota archaeon]